MTSQKITVTESAGGGRELSTGSCFPEGKTVVSHTVMGTREFRNNHSNGDLIDRKYLNNDNKS